MSAVRTPSQRCARAAGKLTVYLGRRDFVDHLDHTDPVDGVIVVEDGYIKNRKVYGSVSQS